MFYNFSLLFPRLLLLSQHPLSFYSSPSRKVASMETTKSNFLPSYIPPQFPPLILGPPPTIPNLISTLLSVIVVRYAMRMIALVLR